MILKRLILTAALVIISMMTAHADGTVFRAKGCGNRLFISSENGLFSVLTQTSGETPAEGDALQGNVVDIGHPLLFDRVSGRTISAIVEDRRLDRTDVAQRIATACRSPTGSVSVSGTVERSIGCGNKIFVSTPDGYVILERLAGGVVNHGDLLTGALNRPGRTTVENHAGGGTLQVFVDDYDLSRSTVNARIASSCRER